MRADLHLHTTSSDGSLTPTQVAEWAKNNNLQVIAITDHDSIDGLDEGHEACKKQGITMVDGIELSTYSICEIHILGYNFEYKNPAFAQELRKVKDMRIERNLRIEQKLNALGIKTDIDFSLDGLGRKTMAREIVAKGYCRDISDAFEKYLGVRGKAYCEAKRLAPVEAVELIKKFGGTAVVAHPKRYLLDKRLDMLLAGIKSHGLDGLEVQYPTHTPQDIVTFEGLCKKYHLLQTGGSDFHGDEERKVEFDINRSLLERLTRH